jgi:uncharacterized membrane protein YqaE (UPF0057 family)
VKRQEATRALLALQCTRFRFDRPEQTSLIGVEYAPPERGQTSETRRGRERMDLLRIIAAILLPPLGVFLKVGFGGHFWLNILLTLLGYVPGIVHAVWIIARR